MLNNNLYTFTDILHHYTFDISYFRYNRR